MTYDELKALYEATTNPAQKEIYGNHLRRMDGSRTGCGPCLLDEPVVEDEMVTVEDEMAVEPDEEV